MKGAFTPTNGQNWRMNGCDEVHENLHLPRKLMCKKTLSPSILK
jgi:hypothetical protein